MKFRVELITESTKLITDLEGLRVLVAELRKSNFGFHWDGIYKEDGSFCNRIPRYFRFDNGLIRVERLRETNSKK